LRVGAVTHAVGDGPVDLVGLGEQVRAAIVNAALDGLSQAAAAGAVIGGHDVLELALRDGRVVEMIVAKDASERTVADLREAAGPEVPFTVLPIDRMGLGTRVGRGARAALGVLSSRAASHLVRQLRRLRVLG
jgi:ribosomal protein L7Ae-like RNA K-turn-binding protein